MVKKRKIYLIALITLVMCITTLFGLSTINAYAFSGTNSSLSEQELYNATNTYNVNAGCFEGNGDFHTIDDSSRKYSTQYEISYNLTQKNNNQVMDSAQITVLTHGLGSDASIWSNAYSSKNLSTSFAYDAESLINKISDEVGGANIYWAEMSAFNAFNLYNISNQTNSGSLYTKSNIVNNINDTSKHIIIVFDAYKYVDSNDKIHYTSEESNANIYYQFNYMLSKIIYDVKIANGGILPKVNLVGHSRGGLTNLQYALDHPDLVSTLVSLGTPYFSSTTANLFGEMFMGAGDGLDDILDPDIYYDYNRRWNQNYNTLYRDIDVYAMGSYHTLPSLKEVVLNDYSGTIPNNAKLEINEIINKINLAKILIGNNNLPQSFLVSCISELLDILFPNSAAVDLAEILTQEINYDIYPMFVSWYSDILVPLESQLGHDSGSVEYGGSSYLGFNEYVRTFNILDGTDYEKVSQANVPVGHNLIARDKLVIAEIVSVLDLGGDSNFAYVTIKNEDDTVSFAGYRGEYLSSVFYLPETIDGETVTEISAYAFDGKTNITEIVLPNTIKKISTSAFAGLENLTTITFSGNGLPQLEEIGYGAFAGCTNLNKFNSSSVGALNMPTSVEFIDCYAFYGTNFSTISLGANIAYIGDVAFSNINSLTSINIPDSATSIGYGAFSGCSSLTNITIPAGVTSIGKGVFVGCNNLNIIVSPNNSNYSAQDNILYNKAKTKIISTGDIASNITISNTIIEVEEYAFSNNTNLQRVDIYGTPIIGDFAFYNCTNLNEVYYYTYEVPELGVGAFDDNEFTLYVPHSRHSVYEIEFARYTNNITSIPIEISFIVDGEEYDTLNTYYGASITGVENPFKEGYTFNWWIDDEGNEYQNGDIWDSMVDLTVEAVWTARQAYINFVGYGTEGIESKIATYDMPIGALPTPNVTSPTFIGWKDNNGLYYTADVIWKRTNNLTLIADYQGEESGNTILYYVDLDQDGGEGGSDNVKAEYLAPMPTATAPTRVGYTFNGYYTGKNGNGNKYYNADMSSAKNWDIASDRTLYAYWIGNEYVVTLDMQGGSGGVSNVTVRYGSPMPEISAPTKTHYVLVGFFENQNGSGKKYYDGSNMTSVSVWDKLSNTTLYAYWHGVEYDISYQNLWFMERRANVLLDRYLNQPEPNKYTYGEGLDLNRVTAYWEDDGPNQPQLIFLGWYTNMDFTTKVESIGSGTYGTVTLYAKWRYDFTRESRYGTYTITHADPYSANFYDDIYIGLNTNNLYTYLGAIGIRYISIEFKINIKEVDDGYQEIYIYDGLSSSSNLLWDATKIEHVSGSANANFEWYIWTVEFSIYSLRNLDYLYFRYGADGKDADTWITQESYMDVMFTAKSGEYIEPVPDFYWSDMDIIEDNDCTPLDEVTTESL